MSNPPDDAARQPDWVIDLSTPPPSRMGDPRLPLAAGVLRATRSQLRAIVATTAAIEEVIRDAASQGAQRDTLAAELSLSVEAVDRVLGGGTIFDWP